MGKQESAIQNGIKQALNLRGHLCERANVGSFKTKDGRYVETGLPNGFPDLFGCRKSDNQIFFLEVKTLKGRISDNQKIYHDKLLTRNVIHGVARTIEEGIKIVEEGLVGHGYPLNSSAAGANSPHCARPPLQTEVRKMKNPMRTGRHKQMNLELGGEE